MRERETGSGRRRTAENETLAIASCGDAIVCTVCASTRVVKSGLILPKLSRELLVIDGGAEELTASGSIPC